MEQKNFVITIARGYGSGGRRIAQKLSEELGIPFYDRKMIVLASQDSGLSEELFARVDERLRGSYVTNILRNWAASTAMPSPEERAFVSDLNLFRLQKKVIEHLADSESCIIVGRCADYILRDRSNVLSVYVEADREYCLKSIKLREDLSREEAEEKLISIDKHRADYYKCYTEGGDWTNPVNYDLTLNTGRLGIDTSCELIRQALRLKLGAEV